MPKRIRKDPITGGTNQQLPMAILAGVAFFGIFAWFASFFPYISTFALYIALPIAFIGTVSMIWINQKPNLWAKFLGFLSMAILWTICAIRSLNFLLPSLSPFLEIAIILTVVVAHSLPYFNFTITKVIKTELSYHPKTSVGKFLLKITLTVLPITGVFGAAIGLFSKRIGSKEDISIAIMGLMCWILAMVLPFSSNQPISPWDYSYQKKHAP